MAQDAEKLEAQAHRLQELKGLSRRTYKQIAEAVDVTERQVQRWFAGDGDISGENLKKLAAFLGTSADFIEYGRERQTPSVFAEAAVSERLAALEEQIRLLRAELAVRDAEALQQNAPSRRPKRSSR